MFYVVPSHRSAAFMSAIGFAISVGPAADCPLTRGAERVRSDTTRQLYSTTSI